MGVDRVGEIYLCKICGNEVIVTKVGGGALMCCGKEMELTGNDGEDGEDAGEQEEDESE